MTVVLQLKQAVLPFILSRYIVASIDYLYFLKLPNQRP